MQQQEKPSVQDAKRLPARSFFLGVSVVLVALGALRAGVLTIVAGVQFLSLRAFVWDAGMYWAVGRAILNGLLPYQDVFENKPPAIFLLSALSQFLFGDHRLGNIIGAAGILVTPFACVCVAWIFSRRQILSQKAILCSFAFLSGSFWALFQAEKGGPWQTESFGASFALLYTMLLIVPGRFSFLRIAGCAVALMGAIGFKEPFLLSCAAAALLLADRPRDLVRSLVLPLFIAICAGAMLLFFLGYLGPYFGTYVPALFGYRISAFGPLWLRPFAPVKLWTAFAGISPVAPLATIALFASVPFFRPTLARDSWLFRDLLSSLAILLLALYIGLLSVGFAGDFQAHHFVFFAPVFFAAVFLVIRKASGPESVRFSRPVILMLLFFWTLTALTSRVPAAQRFSEQDIASAKAAAAGIDVVLDRCTIDRYLLFTGGGLQPYAFTRHSPMNHSLFWQIDNAVQYGQTFLDISIGRLSRAQVVVFPLGDITPSNDIGVSMVRYIVETFTPSAPSCANPLPETPGYRLFFRQKPDPFSEKIRFVDGQ